LNWVACVYILDQSIWKISLPSVCWRSSSFLRRVLWEGRPSFLFSCKTQ